MVLLKHYDLEEAVRRAVHVESPEVEIDMEQLRRNLGAGFDVLDTEHPLKRLKEWIERREALALACATEDILRWIEDDLATLSKVE